MEVSFVPPSGEEWESLVRTAGNSCFLHSHRFLGYHGERFVEQVAVARDRRGRLVAGLRFVEESGVAVSHPGSTFGGILYNYGAGSSGVLSAAFAIAEALRARGIRRMRVRPLPSLLRPSPDEADLYALTRLGGYVARRDLSSMLGLGAGLRLSHGRRQQIKRAQQAGISITESRKTTSFHEILSAALTRHGAVPVHTVQELDALLSLLPTEVRLFTAQATNGDVVAGALVFDFGSVAHTQYLAANEQGRAVGALDLVISFLATEVFALRAFLSFGISTENGGTYLNEGLASYKESFGGRSQIIDTYEVPL